MTSEQAVLRRDVDVVIVGAGFAGLLMLHRLRQEGWSVLVLEAGAGVGGTWFWNRYPGARCDVESLEYQFGEIDGVQKGWTWTERYSGQREIEGYLNHVADALDLRRDIELNQRVRSAVFGESTSTWEVTTENDAVVTARFCVMATGCLSAPVYPAIVGLESFSGGTFHTSEWPSGGVAFSGKHVAIVGTGSSGVQAIPEIAAQADHLFVLQRTPAFVLPAANRPLDADEHERRQRSLLADRRHAKTTSGGTLASSNPRGAFDVSAEERDAEFRKRWLLGGFAFNQSFNNLLTDHNANDTAADFVRARIREVVVDPNVADTLSPTDYPIGAKRICLGTDYYETFNRPNVTLVDVRADPIGSIVPSGVVLASGREIAVDTLVFATGFDAMTGALNQIDIRGRTGLPLRVKWEDGPLTYLGLMSAGFPNLFIIAGPGSPSVLSNVVVSIEQHVDWVAQCLGDLAKSGAAAIEATASAEDAWVDHVNEVASKTLYPQAKSWYMGANIPGKKQVFMPYVGGLPAYRQKCDDARAGGYTGFTITNDAASTLRSPSNAH